MSLSRAAAIVAEMRAGVAFTGAGVSTESGIPDFRSPGGVWSKYDPEEFAFPRFVSSAEARRKYWAFGLEMYPHMVKAQPNPGHLALGELDPLERDRPAGIDRRGELVTSCASGPRRTPDAERFDRAAVEPEHGDAAHLLRLSCSPGDAEHRKCGPGRPGQPPVLRKRRRVEDPHE